ncbi:hypothetical protein L3V82_12565 [Thiotrichales bacterium 19S3-7]|nr:hypothetical protein [Thiotrichales bacterium 19S3-7]MCF6802777.1 hypothetical protein [Thiotrichales bacterium 19S3-11]
MKQSNINIDKQSLVKSKYAARDELREEINKSFGDPESLFSSDSDLLQIVTYSLINLFEAIKGDPELSAILDKMDTDGLKSIDLLSQGLKDRALIFPISIKRQYKSQDELVTKIGDRYTKTSSCLEHYYQSLNLTDNKVK